LSSPSLLLRVGLSLVVLLTCVATLEVAGRVLFTPPPLPPPLIPDSQTGWALPPSSQFVMGDVNHHFNSLGLRGHEPVELSGVIRLLVLGDSSAFGWEVGEDESFAGRLEMLVARGRPADVQNGGVPGFSCPQSLSVYERVSSIIPPDILVVYSLTSDTRLSTGGGYPLAEPVFGPLGIVGIGRLASQASYWLRSRTNAPLLTGRRYHACIEELVERQQAQDGQVVLVVPLTLDVFPPEMQKRPLLNDPNREFAEVLKQLAEQHQVPLLDCAEIVGDASPQDLLLDEVHPNQRGHALIADRLYEIISDQGWLE